MKKLFTFAACASISKLSGVKMINKEPMAFPLQGVLDDYNCLHVQLQDKEDPLHFKNNLQTTLSQCKEQNLKAIWIRLEASQLGLADTLIQHGFQMHHCTEDYLLFSQWLHSEPNKLPNFTTHYVGAGGIIIHNNRLLLVQEKNGLKREQWGVPNGLLDYNELISEGASREIKEETNLDVVPKDLLMIREIPKGALGKSDIYFAFLMELKDPNQQIEICDKELMAYKWVPIDELAEFAKSVNMGATQRRLMETIIDYQRSRRRNEQLFDIVAGTRRLHGKEQRYAMYKPNL